MSDDPFASDSDDRTVYRPSRRGRGANASGDSRAHADVAHSHGGQYLPPRSGINPLEKAASKILPLVFTIRHSVSHPNPVKLHSQLIKQLEEFKQEANLVLNDKNTVNNANYVLCSVLDDAVMNTPWGHDSNWAQHNLVATFYKQAISGEQFFKKLKSLAVNPQENIELLELMFVCLSLGYEGRYRIVDNGPSKLQEIRMWLFEIIRRTRSLPDKSLSLYWQGSSVKESKLPRKTAIWVIGAAALALSSLVYMGYRYSLGAKSDTAIASFFGIKPDNLEVSSIAIPETPPASSSVGPQALTLPQLLEPLITLNQIEVTDTHDEGNIKFLGNNLFASGRTELNTELDPAVQAVSLALDQFKGSILVTGHSDNVPIRSGRFSSNLELSQLRAESMAERLGGYLADPSRVTAEGRGSLEPIADNSSAEGRALNRRVEISIFY